MNTSTITLYKDAKFDVFKRMSNFASKSDRDTYYNGLTKLTLNARYNKIGEPFLVDNDIATLSGYTSGKVAYKGIDWFFTVTDLYVIAEGITEVRYTLNAWETFRYAGNLTLGAGQITRKAMPNNHNDVLIEGGYVRSSIEPIAYNIIDVDTELGTSRRKPCVLAIGRDNTSDFTQIICLDIEDTSRNHALTNTSAFAKYIIDAMTESTPNFELIGMWYSSYEPDISQWTNTNKNRVYYIKVTDETFNMSKLLINCNVAGIESTTFNNDSYGFYAITDERGNIIYNVADGCLISRSYSMVLNITMSSCQWIGIVTYTQGTEVTKFSDIFSIACEPLDFFNDSWATYQSTQRQIDIDSRVVENNTSFFGSVASAGTSALSGAMMGAIAGPIGAGLGAVLGAGASVVGGAVNSLISGVYTNPKEQELTDEAYKRASDNLSLQGNGVNGVMFKAEFIDSANTPVDRFGAGFKRFNFDYMTIMKIQGEELVYGVPVNVITNDVDSEIANGPFQATCEVNGIPADWAGQVQQRLADGVIFSSG